MSACRHCSVVRHTSAVLVACALSSAAWAGGRTPTADVLRYALPASVLAYELFQDDRQGVLQLGESLAVTLGASEVLKHVVHESRPDMSNNRSFPSGHASSAFAAATFVHRRYGFESAWPLYAAATYVGYARVHADRHHWGDIAGSAALAAASAWWLVDPKPSGRVSVLPMLGPRGVAVVVNAAW